MLSLQVIPGWFSAHFQLVLGAKKGALPSDAHFSWFWGDSQITIRDRFVAREWSDRCCLCKCKLSSLCWIFSKFSKAQILGREKGGLSLSIRPCKRLVFQTLFVHHGVYYKRPSDLRTPHQDEFHDLWRNLVNSPLVKYQGLFNEYRTQLDQQVLCNNKW